MAESSTKADAAGGVPTPFEASSLKASLTVKDLRASIAWYRDVIGFTVEREYERGGSPMGAALRAGSIEILVTQDDGAKGLDRAKGDGMSIQFTTTQDIDAVARGIQERGGVLDGELMTSPRGARVFRLRDPDGFRLSISTGP
jgi:uncharacterized glyoxalase superfamily protein PhnB